jgi:hypothetical protein
LHLDLKLQVRFKSRWDEIKRAVSEQEREYEAEGMWPHEIEKKDCSCVSVGYAEHEQTVPSNEGQRGLTEQAPSITVHETQAQDGSTTHAEDQPEFTKSTPAPATHHQSHQQQQAADDQPSFDLSEFVGFEEPPLNDDDNWDDDDGDTARAVNTTADTFTSLAHTEMSVQNNEGEGEAQYTDSQRFPEGQGVSAEYGEYEEGEWGAEEGHEEGESAPVEQTEAPAAGQVVDQGQVGTIEAGTSSPRLEKRKD